MFLVHDFCECSEQVEQIGILLEEVVELADHFALFHGYPHVPLPQEPNKVVYEHFFNSVPALIIATIG